MSLSEGAWDRPPNAYLSTPIHQARTAIITAHPPTHLHGAAAVHRAIHRPRQRVRAAVQVGADVGAAAGAVVPAGAGWRWRVVLEATRVGGGGMG